MSYKIFRQISRVNFSLKIKFFLIFVSIQPFLDCAYKALLSYSHIERKVEVSTYFSPGGKIYSDTCVEVSHRGDTQRHMLKRRRYAREWSSRSR